MGYLDNYRGWYDTRNCGACNDYCRWVGNSGPGGDPSVRTRYRSSFWACHRPDYPYFHHNNGSYWNGKFQYKKCNGRGDKPPKQSDGNVFELNDNEYI